ncbi:hypothetical protein PIB30_069470 [Stylosanthes scabra]|uniref:GIR1-like zinc ribbon domain-containing protein n=1 Tax=Stylosanthes scabra TaxID=79078 RepID=A0ABU6VMN8_9FABA|nr:hypothetical protein [Stylosanthes scabra]
MESQKSESDATPKLIDMLNIDSNVVSHPNSSILTLDALHKYFLVSFDLNQLAIVESSGAANKGQEENKSNSKARKNGDLKDDDDDDEVSSLVVMGCNNCYLYVMVPKNNPECPRCKNHNLLDVANIFSKHVAQEAPLSPTSEVAGAATLKQGRKGRENGSKREGGRYDTTAASDGGTMMIVEYDKFQQSHLTWLPPPVSLTCCRRLCLRCAAFATILVAARASSNQRERVLTPVTHLNAVAVRRGGVQRRFVPDSAAQTPIRPCRRCSNANAAQPPFRPCFTDPTPSQVLSPRGDIGLILV